MRYWRFVYLEQRLDPRRLPLPGYTRKLSHDEEGRLTKISRDNGTTITPVFEYGEPLAWGG
jgi:hypothetical protein